MKLRTLMHNKVIGVDYAVRNVQVLEAYDAGILVERQETVLFERAPMIQTPMARASAVMGLALGSLGQPEPNIDYPLRSVFTMAGTPIEPTNPYAFAKKLSRRERKAQRGK